MTENPKQNELLTAVLKAPDVAQGEQAWMAYVKWLDAEGLWFLPKEGLEQEAYLHLSELWEYEEHCQEYPEDDVDQLYTKIQQLDLEIDRLKEERRRLADLARYMIDPLNQEQT